MAPRQPFRAPRGRRRRVYKIPGERGRRSHYGGDLTIIRAHIENAEGGAVQTCRERPGCSHRAASRALALSALLAALDSDLDDSSQPNRTRAGARRLLEFGHDEAFPRQESGSRTRSPEQSINELMLTFRSFPRRSNLRIGDHRPLPRANEVSRAEIYSRCTGTWRCVRRNDVDRGSTAVAVRSGAVRRERGNGHVEMGPG